MAVLSLFLLLATIRCEFPYAPRSEPPLVLSHGQEVESRVRVFPLVGTMQICNPSVALDTVNFKGCMLWLNFSGTLPLTIPTDLAGFTAPSAQHDRLTIVDTANVVTWFMLRSELGGDALEELQDPEWSTHPEYIACLLSAERQQEWSCFAIHPASRDTLRICSGGLDQTSTPHLWAAPASTHGEQPLVVTYDPDGFADSTSVATFFGTTAVKVVFAKSSGRVQSLYYRDYRAGGGVVPLKRPAGRSGYNCESPLISPDGKWVTYNVYKSTSSYECYISELTPESTPQLFASGASDPHWWVHPRDPSLLYIVYQQVPGDNLVAGDLADAALLATGEAGVTMRQMVRLFTGTASASAALVRLGLPELLVNLPTKGGLSPDGSYLSTGYDRAFMVGLP